MAENWFDTNNIPWETVSVLLSLLDMHRHTTENKMSAEKKNQQQVTFKTGLNPFTTTVLLENDQQKCEMYNTDASLLPISMLLQITSLRDERCTLY